MNIRTLTVALLLLPVLWGASRLLDGRNARGEPAAQVSETPPARARLDGHLATALADERASIGAGLPPLERRDLDALYAGRPGEAVWLTSDGQPGAQARAGLGLLEQAAAEGLDPADYGWADLATVAANLDAPAPRPASLAARFDVGLSASVLRYYRHLHLGRVDPRTLGLQLTIPGEAHDFATVLRTAIDENRVGETAVDLEPPLAQYRTLKEMLVRYRALAAEPLEAPVFPDTVRPGDRVDGLPALSRLLTAIGDLSPDASPPVSDVYDDRLRAGVVRFQERHGLDSDGTIGPATQTALRVPLQWRTRQIELALERLRWLPDLSNGPLIAVNIPMFRLWAWGDITSSEMPDLSMRVIVGKALNTRTPVFADRMRFVIFRPYWNVPRSILRGEILPAIRRNPGYLAREQMEIVRGESDGSPVLAETAGSVAELASGAARVRQRPGPKNALGLIKFMFPNQNDVYMHGTPAPLLFARSRRDFSHGCIRVEDPAALAAWVLRRNATWTREAIDSAMNGAANRRVDLPEPVQVLIFYTTAVAMPEDGSMHFAADLYDQDRRLDEAL